MLRRAGARERRDRGGRAGGGGREAGRHAGCTPGRCGARRGWTAGRAPRRRPAGDGEGGGGESGREGREKSGGVDTRKEEVRWGGGGGVRRAEAKARGEGFGSSVASPRTPPARARAHPQARALRRGERTAFAGPPPGDYPGPRGGGGLAHTIATPRPPLRVLPGGPQRRLLRCPLARRQALITRPPVCARTTRILRLGMATRILRVEIRLGYCDPDTGATPGPHAAPTRPPPPPRPPPSSALAGGAGGFPPPPSRGPLSRSLARWGVSPPAARGGAAVLLPRSVFRPRVRPRAAAARSSHTCLSSAARSPRKLHQPRAGGRAGGGDWSPPPAPILPSRLRRWHVTARGRPGEPPAAGPRGVIGGEAWSRRRPRHEDRWIGSPPRPRRRGLTGRSAP